MKPAKVSQLVSFLSSDIDAIQALEVNSAAGTLSAYGGNLNQTSYYDESVTAWPTNKRLIIVSSFDHNTTNVGCFAYPSSEAVVRGIYAGAGKANGQGIRCLDIRFKRNSAVVVQHDLFNSTYAVTMDLTISNVGNDGIFVGTVIDGSSWEWHGAQNINTVNWSKTSNTNIRMVVDGGVDGDAIWPSQVIIPNGAF